MKTEERFQTIEEVRSEAIICCRCDLCYKRTNVVFGQGPVPATLMLVGESPGAEEDRAGQPFVGKSGKRLDTILEDAGIKREDVWLTNIVRCRAVIPSASGARNRKPRPDEIKACEIWMNQEIRFISPKFIVCLGIASAQALISPRFKMIEGRGRWHQGRHDIPTTATYHPALRFLGPEKLRSVETLMLDDFRMVARRLAVL